MPQIKKLLQAACREAPDGLSLRWTRDGIEARMTNDRVQRIRYEAMPSLVPVQITRDVVPLDHTEAPGVVHVRFDEAGKVVEERHRAPRGPGAPEGDLHRVQIVIENLVRPRIDGQGHLDVVAHQQCV